MLSLYQNSKPIHFLFFLLIGSFVGFAVSYVAEMPHKALFVVALGLAFPFATFLIKDLRRFLIGATIFTIPIHIDINFMHKFENQAGAATAGISVTDIMIIGLLLLWLIEIASQDRPYAVFFSRLSIPAILYIEAAVLSMLWAPRLDLAFMEVFRMIKVFLLFLMLLNHIRDERDLRLAMWALIGTVAFQGVIAGLQIIKGGRLGLDFLGEAPPDPDGNSSLWRVMGTLGHPNKLATFLELLLLLPLGAFLIEAKKRLKAVSLVVLGLGLVIFIMTGSRGAWIGFVIAFIVFIYFVMRNKHIDTKTIVKPAIAATLLMVIVGIAFSDMLTERIFGEDHGSAESRIPMYQIAVNIISAHPIGGVGINNYQVNMREYNDSVRAMRYTTIPRPVHNMFLLVAGETGFIGLSAMMLMLTLFMLTLLKTTSSSTPLYAVLSICILGGVIAFCVHGMVDKHPPGNYAPFYAVMAIGAAAYVLDRKQRHSHHS